MTRAVQETACTPGLDQLYITTSRLDPGADAGPGAGAPFRADVGVTGLPAAAVAG